MAMNYARRKRLFGAQAIDCAHFRNRLDNHFADARSIFGSNSYGKPFLAERGHYNESEAVVSLRRFKFMKQVKCITFKLQWRFICPAKLSKAMLLIQQECEKPQSNHSHERKNRNQNSFGPT